MVVQSDSADRDGGCACFAEECGGDTARPPVGRTQWATLRSVLKDPPEAVNDQAAQDDLKRDARDTHDESDSDDKHVLEQYAER